MGDESQVIIYGVSGTIGFVGHAIGGLVAWRMVARREKEQRILEAQVRMLREERQLPLRADNGRHLTDRDGNQA